MLGAMDKKGEKIMRKRILKQGTGFYEKVYESNHPLNNEYLKEIEEEEEVPTILETEVEEAIIAQLKNNKTLGEDGIINECLKWGGKNLKKEITMMFNKILTTENIPAQWKTSTIILLHKKEKRYDLNNYRPISLISNLYNVFLKVIANRITTTMDENQTPEKAGIRAGYSTIDHLQAVRQIIEKYQEFNINLYIAFID
jgi:hypothetical protein